MIFNLACVGFSYNFPPLIKYKITEKNHTTLTLSASCRHCLVPKCVQQLPEIHSVHKLCHWADSQAAVQKLFWFCYCYSPENLFTLHFIQMLKHDATFKKENKWTKKVHKSPWHYTILKCLIILLTL